MKDETLLFKAVTFLAALLKSGTPDVYLNEGFTPDEMINELSSLNTYAPTGFQEEYKDKIADSIDEVLTCLCNEGLIYFKDNRYYITDEGESISSFMMTLSKKYFEQSDAIMDLPYRYYPNSKQIYGLN